MAYELKSNPSAHLPTQNPGTTVVYINDNDVKSQLCPQCKNFNTMEYNDVISTRQHLWAVCLCLTCWICCWIPYVSNECMFNRGKCKKCGYVTKDKTNNTGLKVAIGIIAIIIIIIIIIAVVNSSKTTSYYRF